MPDVPQNIDDILPAVRRRAATLTAQLRALEADLRAVSDRRHAAGYDEGQASLASGIEAFRWIAEPPASTEAGSPAADPRAEEPGE